MTDRAQDVQRVRELEALGATFSRNKDYAFYKQPPNGRARRLRRFLRELAGEIATHRGTLTITEEDGRYRLLMVAPALGYQRTIMLHPEELAYLRGLVPSLD